MFSRRAIKHTAWTALIAVLFAVLLPAAGHAGGKFASLAGLHDLCTTDGVKQAPNVPSPAPLSGAAAHKPCVFCISSVPVFADTHAPRVVAIVQGALLTLRAPGNSPELPPDIAATQPLSPRAPPRTL